MVKLDLGDNANLQDIISAAILQTLDEKKRESLLTQAIAYLLTPERAYAGAPARSPLEDAYKTAVESQARRMAFDMLDKDEALKEKLRGLLTEAMERAFVTHREATVERVANAISEGMWKRDGDR